MIKRYTPDDADWQSKDLIAENVETMKALFPQAFTEGKIDFSVLRQLLGDQVDDSDERYGLFWHGKRKARQLALMPSTGTLRPMKEDSVDWDATKNIFIEGDNLEVLKLLQKSYAGKVKLIYIDPPYNTGKDFVYPDDFLDGVGRYLSLTGQAHEGSRITSNAETSGRFHSAWMNMLFPRLLVAAALLRADGLICISIDDFERDSLRKLCDEVFGEENFVESIVWKKRYGGGAKEKHLVSLHEYILVYAKDVSALGELYVAQSAASISRYYLKTDDKVALRGPFRTHPLEATKSMGDRPNLVFPIDAPDGSTVTPKRQWLWSRDRVEEARLAGDLDFIRDRSGGWSVHTKQYLRDENGEVRKAKVFSIVEGVYSQHGTNELLELFGDAHIFPFPKPLGLLKSLLAFGAPSEADIVLDFFAGSGSLGHAVMSQCESDGIGRQHISVQLPEELRADDPATSAAFKLCDSLGVRPSLAEVTKERLRRSGRQLREESPARLRAVDVGFRAYRLDTSNLAAWNTAPANLPEALLAHTSAIRADRTDDDLATEILLKLGLELTHPCDLHTLAGKRVRVYSGILYLCFDAFTSADVDAFVDGLGALHRQLSGGHPVQSTVIFRDDRLGSDAVKTNLAAGLEHRGIVTVRSL